MEITAGTRKSYFFPAFLFMGITTALVFSYVVLPQEAVHEIFDLQEKAIGNVNKYVQGNTIKELWCKEPSPAMSQNLTFLLK